MSLWSGSRITLELTLVSQNAPVVPVSAYPVRKTHSDDSLCAQTPCSVVPLPLKKWLYAIYLMVTARKSISSLQR